MNLNDYESRFIVYRHISPTGKQYVGITSKSITERWGTGGSGYKDNKHFWSAICRYGWDSFIHEVIASDLSLEDACKLECELISEFDLMNPDNGYNQTSGGQYSTPSKAVRAKLKTSTTDRWKDPEFRNTIVSKLTGHSVSKDTRDKISIANSRAWKAKISNGWQSPLRGRKLSEEHINKLRGRTPVTKGKTKYDSEIVARISKKVSGTKRNDEQKRNMSRARKNKYMNGYSPIWINNGVKETTIDASCQVIPDGYVRGRLDKNYKYINKDGCVKRVPSSDVSNYVQDGWKVGRGCVLGIKKASQKFVWIIDGLEFETAKDVAIYLNKNGYPKIVDSTITSLYNKGFEKSKTYSSLSGRIQRRVK